MKYMNFGNTGLLISQLGLGTQTFGWNIDYEESKNLMNYYYENGGNYFDTADSYNDGESERILGKWLKETGNREECIIGTKTFFPTGNGINNSGCSRKHIYQSVETSLKRLNTDYIDLLQIHCYDKQTPLFEVLRTLSDLVNSGKVRHIGISNFTPSKILEMQMLAKYERLCPISSLQLEYSLLVRSPEWELIPVCKEQNIGMLAWSPLSGGWLTGKYRRNKDIPENSRAGRQDRWDDSAEQRGNDKAYNIIEELYSISETVNKPISQISLNWMIQKHNIIPLIGARNIFQLKENLGAVEWSLNDEDIKKLDEVSKIELPSPYSFIEKYTRK